MIFGAISNPRTYSWYPDWITAAERAGFALLSSGDSQSLWSDPFVSLAVAAGTASQACLAVTVSNPRTRHPAVAASALAALNQLAPGRIVYGLGSGDSALKNLGLRPARASEVADYALAVQRLCGGEEVEWEGARIRVRWSAFDLPILLAAEGPVMQRLAGRIADGVLLSNALDESVLAGAAAQIRSGAESVGRDPARVEIWCMAAMCFAASRDEAIHRLRALLAGTANHVYRFHLDGKEVPERYVSALEELRHYYDYRHHASPESARGNADLVDRLGLVDFLADRSVIAGPPQVCLDRIRQLETMGVDRLLVHHQADDPLEFMDTFASGITPYLGPSVKA